MSPDYVLEATILWFTTRNIYLVLSTSGTELLKPLEKGIFCYVNEVTLGTAPKDGGWLLGDPTVWLEGWNFQFHPTPNLQTPRDGGEGLHRWAMASDLINHARVMKSKRRGFRELLGWWTCGGWGRVSAQKGRGSSAPLLHTLALCISSIWLFPSCILL